MVTQLEDVANKVEQENVGLSGRLRNEEIRRKMMDDWQAPSEDVNSTTSNTIQDATNKDTLAKTYSALLNNWQATNGGSSTNEQGDYYSGSSTIGLPSWTPTAVGLAAKYGGLGQYASLASAATSLLQGNKTAAASTLAGALTSKLTGGKIPGLGGVISSLAGGLLGDKSWGDIGQDIGNSGIGTLITMSNPVAGAIYSAARAFGFNPIQGLSSLFDSKDYASEGGHVGGFFTKPSDYNGYTPGQPYEPGNKNLNFGMASNEYDTNNDNYWSDTGNQINNNSYTNDSSSYGYSNPASSYGSWGTPSSDSSSGSSGD